jgi:hypothetical protein
VKAVDLVVDGGVFESRIEDIDRLVCARHSAILLLVVIRLPSGCRSGRKVKATDVAVVRDRKLAGWQV